MNAKLLIAAAMAFSLAAVGAADAAHKHKRKKVRVVAPVAAMPYAPYGARTPGPVWAQPNECYTDEGYGRYTPCGAGKDD
jgi:hypothetical protein